MAERAAEVIVVGGGVIGASAAYYLTRLGLRDVLVLEQRFLAAGA
ncbi:MAG: FAD-dependent oxidoreductase, partial [Chloroflexota bacterium]|nr:FAD-dependent oxidoreductase [Chloroflexota bacterium]